MQTLLITLPAPLQQAIRTLLARPAANGWLARGQSLHARYMEQAVNQQQNHLSDYVDTAAYLGLRATATYAQITGALAAVQEIVPGWQPQTMLDLGCGPGTGVWAASTLFPTIQQAACLDQNPHMLALGQQLLGAAALPVTATWQQGDLLERVGQAAAHYDLVLLANVLNELDRSQRDQLLTAAFARCRGLLLVLEPGTPLGSAIVQESAQSLAPQGHLLVPYMGQHFVAEHFLHFPQRFTRPDFARRMRQEMRTSSLMASDWEEAKYSYVAIGKIPAEVQPWGRCIGPVRLLNGYLEIPILTKEAVLQAKVMKRHKRQYALARKLRWGELVMQRSDLIDEPSS
jgi:ribosomal protein RSM22 (predicted rRNA methylase)